MFKRPHFVATFVVVALALGILNLPQPASARLKLAIGGLYLPLFGLVGAIQTVTQRVEEAFSPRQNLSREIEQLRRENQELTLQLRQQEELARSNDRFREMIGFAKSAPWKLKAARVVGRDPANWWRTLQIDLGDRDGVKPNFPVMTSEGLIGRIESVGFNRSQVVLLGDPACRVSVLASDSREQGVLVAAATSQLDQALVDLIYLPRNSQVKPGASIVTSGQGGVFPRGIPIGTVVDCRQAGYELFSTARVKLAVDPSRIEEVWVIF
jgi:rod shape-determining protein MreC